VIVRGLTIRGGQENAVLLAPGVHDVVIEANDISGWGRYNYTNSAGWQVGVDMDAGVRAKCSNDFTMERFVIQRNRIHDPRYGANAWDWGHPAGPQAITLSYCGGNHVVRYNEIYSSNSQHYFNDAIGGEDNFTKSGFPNYDSDIYGNVVANAMDDGIEAEGGNRNVRIWGNYIDTVGGSGIATTANSVGPSYVFRNVLNRMRKRYLNALDSDDRGTFMKSGTPSEMSQADGRRYVFHNTSLQATGSGATYPLGAGSGLQGQSSEPLTNTVSRNNVFQVWKSSWASFDVAGGFNNDVNYDLYNGSINLTGEGNGLKGTPTYQSGNGPASGSGGMYQLAPSSPGYGKATKLPNFNDDVPAPDVGAHQSGAPAMKFGVNQ
jgi:hypothetical protein